MSVESIHIQVFPDGRMDVKNAARYLGLKEKTLAVMRSAGSGPKFIKLGRVFYFKEDLDHWINAAGRMKSTTQLQLARHTAEEKTVPLKTDAAVE